MKFDFENDAVFLTCSRWTSVQQWSLWKDYASYFLVRLTKEAELDPQLNYFVGSHPHGILGSGAFCNRRNKCFTSFPWHHLYTNKLTELRVCLALATWHIMNVIWGTR